MWCIVGAASVAALFAWRWARAMTARVERLSRMAWELKYQHDELRARVERSATGASSPSDVEPKAARGDDAYIPLSSLKR